MMKKIQTKYCGEMEFEADEVIHFPNGLFGFESFHDFLLICLEDDPASPFCLQSIQDSDLAFILFNPFQLLPSYAPDIPDADCDTLKGEQSTLDPDDLALYVICNLQDTIPESTVNLRCPIVLNVLTRTALQTILPDSYSFRIKFSELAQGGGAPC